MSISTTSHETLHMSAIMFDTLAYTKKLKAAGVPEMQAEAHAEAIADVVQENLASKQDIVAVKQDIKKLEKDLRHEIHEMGYKLTIRLGGIVIGGISVLAILIKIL